MNGCRNIDASLVAERYNLFTKWNDLTSKKESKAKKDEWVKNNIGKIPYFYTSPTPRVYLLGCCDGNTFNVGCEFC